MQLTTTTFRTKRGPTFFQSPQNRNQKPMQLTTTTIRQQHKDQSNTDPAVARALARRLAQKPGVARQITASVARLAARPSEQRKLDGYSHGWHQQRERVKALVHQYEHLTPPELRSSAGLAAALMHTFAPATVASYFTSAVDQFPRYRDQAVKAIRRGIDKRLAQTRRPRLAPMTRILRQNLARMSPNMRTLCLVQAVTASRHADIQAATITHVVNHDEDHHAIRLSWSTWKSDPLGRYFAEKWFAWPTTKIEDLMKTWERRSDWPYDKVWRALEGMTPHDIRRWAITTLGGKMTQEQILIITQHAEATRNTAHVRRYTDPSKQSTTAQIQIQASMHLWREIGEEFHDL
jgi:hypothetical protein